MALDWYKAKIEDAIATVTAQSAYDLCFNRDGTSNPTFALDDPNAICRSIERDARTGAALQVSSPYLNLGLIQTSGVDANVNWRTALADIGLGSVPGNFSVNLSVTKLFEYKAQEFPTAPALENKGTLARFGLFDWRTVTTFRYSLPTWDVGLNWRHLPSVRNQAYVTDHATPIKGADAYDIFGLTASWNINEQLGISGGIDNLLDRDPERVGAGQIQSIGATSGTGNTIIDGVGSTFPAYYDVLGRRYFVNLKLRF